MVDRGDLLNGEKARQNNNFVNFVTSLVPRKFLSARFVWMDVADGLWVMGETQSR